MLNENFFIHSFIKKNQKFQETFIQIKDCEFWDQILFVYKNQSINFGCHLLDQQYIHINYGRCWCFFLLAFLIHPLFIHSFTFTLCVFARKILNFFCLN